MDSFSAKTRVGPALLALCPLILIWGAFQGWSWKLGGGVVMTTFIGAGALVLQSMVRDRGKILENILFSKWGGPPTTYYLRHIGKSLNKETKRRYHRKLQKLLGRKHLPTLAMEKRNLSKADLGWEAAVGILRNKTQDKQKFSLVYQELISYNFRRNIRAICYWGIGASCISIFVELLALSYSVLVDVPVSLSTVIMLWISGFTLGAWAIGPSEKWVQKAGERYAEALLGTLDQF